MITFFKGTKWGWNERERKLVHRKWLIRARGQGGKLRNGRGQEKGQELRRGQEQGQELGRGQE